MRIPIILAVAAFALAGCSPNQDVNAWSPTASQVFAGRYVETNPYNPVSYAQNNTGRGGGRLSPAAPQADGLACLNGLTRGRAAYPPLRARTVTTRAAAVMS